MNQKYLKMQTEKLHLLTNPPPYETDIFRDVILDDIDLDTSDTTEQLIVDLIIEKVHDKQYKIKTDENGNQYMKVYVRHKDIIARTGSKKYDEEVIISVFEQRSAIKRLTVVRDVGKTYKMNGGVLLRGKQAVLYFALAVPLVVPAFIYLAHSTSGDMFFIQNK